METKLFRQEAVAQHTNRLYGRVLVLPKLNHWLLVGLVALWLAAAACWLFGANYISQQVLMGHLDASEDKRFPGEIFATLWVPVTQADVLRPGQTIDISLNDLAGLSLTELNQRHNKNPALMHAQIIEIGEQALLPEEPSQFAMGTHAPTCKVLLRLPEQSLRLFGKRFDLRAGMEITAVIHLPTTTPVKLLLDHFFQTENGDQHP